MKKRKGRVALAAEAARLEDVGAMGSAVPTLEPCSADVQVVPDADLRPVEVATEPVLVPVAESAGLECLSVAAELAVDECGLDELEADVEVRREAGESEEPLGPEGTTERSDAQNPEADANRIAGENCALHDSDLCVPTVLAQMTRVESVPDAGLADFERAPRVAAGGWRAWRWAVAAALLFGALLGGWWLTGAARAVVSREVGGETVRVPVERVPFGVNVEAPFEPRSGP